MALRLLVVSLTTAACSPQRPIDGECSAAVKTSALLQSGVRRGTRAGLSLAEDAAEEAPPAPRPALAPEGAGKRAGPAADPKQPRLTQVRAQGGELAGRQGELDKEDVARLVEVLKDAAAIEGGGGNTMGRTEQLQGGEANSGLGGHGAAGGANGALKDIAAAGEGGAARVVDKDMSAVKQAIEEVSGAKSPEDANDQGELVTAELLRNLNHLDSTPEQASASTSANGNMCVQGDMCARNGQELLLLQQGTNSSLRRWAGPLWTDDTPDDGVTTIPYCFHSSTAASSKQALRDAVQHYRNLVPCVDWQEIGVGSDEGQTCAQNPAIFIKSNEKGCWANVGAVGGTEGTSVCNLNPSGCDSMGVAVHELGHNLGAMHEQSRPDRDDHVRVEMDKVEEDKRDNYNIWENADISIPYDIMSVMHYGDDFFGIDDQKTMFDLKDTGKMMGNRMGLTYADVLQFATMYGCADKVQHFQLCTEDPEGCTDPACVCHPQPAGGKDIIKVGEGSCRRCLEKCPDAPMGTTGTCGCPSEGYTPDQFTQDGTTYFQCAPDCHDKYTNCPSYGSGYCFRGIRFSSGIIYEDACRLTCDHPDYCQ